MASGARDGGGFTRISMPLSRLAPALVGQWEVGRRHRALMLRLSYGSRRRAAVAHTRLTCVSRTREDRHDSNVRPRRLDNPVPSARRTGRGIGKGLPRALPTELRSSESGEWRVESGEWRVESGECVAVLFAPFSANLCATHRGPPPTRGDRGRAVQWESRSSCTSAVSRRPTTDHDALRVTACASCVACSRTITCQTARDARGADLVFSIGGTSKTPHLAFSAGGACPTAPETGGDDRTLPSTPSPAGPCTCFSL